MEVSCIQTEVVYLFKVIKPYIDKSIRLYVVHVFVLQSQVFTSATDAADNTTCYCVAQSKRTAHSHHPFTSSQR